MALNPGGTFASVATVAKKGLEFFLFGSAIQSRGQPGFLPAQTGLAAE
jgi:hypothetical protein